MNFSVTATNALYNVSQYNDVYFLARDAFVRTNRRAIATMFVRLYVCLFVRPSVCLSVWDGRAL